MTILAANLKRGDGVLINQEHRVVEAVEFAEHPVDSSGTTGIRVKWFGIAHTSIIRADKELTLS
jgi:hypothetical protein